MLSEGLLLAQFPDERVQNGRSGRERSDSKREKMCFICRPLDAGFRWPRGDEGGLQKVFVLSFSSAVGGGSDGVGLGCGRSAVTAVYSSVRRACISFRSVWMRFFIIIKSSFFLPLFCFITSLFTVIVLIRAFPNSRLRCGCLVLDLVLMVLCAVERDKTWTEMDWV